MKQKGMHTYLEDGACSKHATFKLIDLADSTVATHRSHEPHDLFARLCLARTRLATDNNRLVGIGRFEGAVRSRRRCKHVRGQPLEPHLCVLSDVVIRVDGEIAVPFFVGAKKVSAKMRQCEEKTLV